MRRYSKTSQLQIRVSPREKALIESRAATAGKSVSAWVLKSVLGRADERFDDLLANLSQAGEPDRPYILAKINDLLESIPARDFASCILQPMAKQSALDANLIAAMVELAAERKNISPPQWTGRVSPLETPYFGTSLQSLRPYLLAYSPVQFRRRNIFIDSSVGDRV